MNDKFREKARKEGKNKSALILSILEEYFEREDKAIKAEG
jgi:hypothetical protein